MGSGPLKRTDVPARLKKQPQAKQINHLAVVVFFVCFLHPWNKCLCDDELSTFAKMTKILS